MSLADELLADLEEMENEDDDEMDTEMKNSLDDLKTDVKPEFAFAVPLPKKLTLDDVCKLRNSTRLMSVLEEVERYSTQNRSSEDIQVITVYNNFCSLFQLTAIKNFQRDLWKLIQSTSLLLKPTI